MIEMSGDDLVVIADNPAEMIEAQHATIGKIGEKIAGAEHSLADARTTLEELTAAGMKTTAADRIVKRAESRAQFLGKVKEALEAGYLIVPEMPCDVVAIRVKRDPKRQHAVRKTSYGGDPNIDMEAAPGLPAGEGKYVDPLPPTERDSFEHKNEKGDTMIAVHRITTGEWNEEIDLPVHFLRPTVVQRTGKTMMRRLFDEIAVIGGGSAFSSSRAKAADPMVVGSVIDRANKRKLWFLVAWFVDTATI